LKIERLKIWDGPRCLAAGQGRHRPLREQPGWKEEDSVADEGFEDIPEINVPRDAATISITSRNGNSAKFQSLMTENEQRFLQEITHHLPAEGIVEIHLFAPLRHSGVESGVAVVASEPETPEAGGNEADPASSSDLRSRFAVHTARYRHTQKGAERGKWEFEIAVEAEAPLLAIDRVVSGVLQRSGEQREPVRLTGAELRASLGGVQWIATT
jgi:hypothetical protein